MIFTTNIKRHTCDELARFCIKQLVSMSLVVLTVLRTSDTDVGKMVSSNICTASSGFIAVIFSIFFLCINVSLDIILSFNWLIFDFSLNLYSYLCVLFITQIIYSFVVAVFRRRSSRLTPLIFANRTMCITWSKNQFAIRSDVALSQYTLSSAAMLLFIMHDLDPYLSE